MKVGFIGLGRMGQGMGKRISSGGQDLIVYSRTREKTAETIARIRRVGL